VRRDVALPAAGERRLEGRLGGLKAFRAIEKNRDVAIDAPLAAGLPAEQSSKRRLEVDTQYPTSILNLLSVPKT